MKKSKEPMGSPRQVRFPTEIEKDLQALAEQSGLEWTDVVRMAARTGLPILKKRLGTAVKEAA